MENNNELKAIVRSVLKQLSDFYNGDLWVTDNLTKKVFSHSSSLVMKKVNGHTHSIAEQVAHIIAWRNFGVQKLTGNSNFDIEDNSPADWPEPVEWDAVQKEFETCHQNLLAAIKNFPDEKWHSTVPGRSYSFIYLINGLVEHDYYHYGQIGVLLSALKKMQG
jgi:uncharacterized damage-inducible protein DinB